MLIIQTINNIIFHSNSNNIRYETFTSVTPIKASRVIISANSSSVICSVPSGLLGSTIYLISELESQTLTSTLSGRFKPNSSRTPLGSFTLLERYAGSLYQAGGNPRSGHG